VGAHGEDFSGIRHGAVGLEMHAHAAAAPFVDFRERLRSRSGDFCSAKLGVAAAMLVLGELRASDPAQAFAWIAGAEVASRWP